MESSDYVAGNFPLTVSMDSKGGLASGEDSKVVDFTGQLRVRKSVCNYGNYSSFIRSSTNAVFISQLR